MPERRKDKRFKAQLLLSTIYKNEEGRIVTEDSVFSEDIAVGGMRIVFPHRLPKGSVLGLKIHLFSDPIQLPAEGRVIWSDKKQGFKLKVKTKKDRSQQVFWVGIQFVNLDQFTQQRILHWLKKEFGAKAEMV